MARGLKDDLPDGESEIFLLTGLDSGFAKLPDGQISYSPKPSFARVRGRRSPALRW
jgi:hypothetical protein